MAPVVAFAALTAACSQEPPTPAEERGAASPAAVETAPDPEPSRYTSLAECRLLRSNPDEGGFYEHECPGEGHYRLRKVQSDLRDNVVVLAPDGAETSLGLPALANGAFSSVGDTAEWRGGAADESFAPRALILRHSVMEDPDPAVPEVSYLVVARLAPQPCVIARVAPGPEQNRQARQAADGTGTCLASPG